ncbi:MAG: carbon-nitrogen hydrolase family protein [bacterium]
MRAGIFQCAGGGLTPRQRLDRLNDSLAGSALDLVVCPELFISGYNVGDALRELAAPLSGDYSERVAEIAISHHTAIVFGYPEIDGEQLYNAAACISADGLMIANHRKLLLPPGFELEYFQPGEQLTLFELFGMRCAILICYDAEYPEAVRACAESGAQVVIVPTALVDNWGSVAHQLMPTRAFESGVWLLYANHAGEENGFRYLGASCIVAPDGKDAARAGAEQCLIHYELNQELVSRARNRLPYLKDVKLLRKILSK